MNLGAIKQNLISLGFAEESDLDEFVSLGYVNDAINRAISTIGTQFPYIKKYDLVVADTSKFETIDDFLASTGEEGVLYLYPETDELHKKAHLGDFRQYVWSSEWLFAGYTDGVVGVDMENVTDDFLCFTFEAVKHEVGDTGMYVKFADYEIEPDGHTIWINASDEKGKFWIYYEAKCEDITDDTDEEYEPSVPEKVHHLIPLLSAYYLWLDDDQVKATQYYNMYETELMLVSQKEQRPRMRILKGGL